jgi:hypothetical protein
MTLFFHLSSGQALLNLLDRSPALLRLPHMGSSLPSRQEPGRRNGQPILRAGADEPSRHGLLDILGKIFPCVVGECAAGDSVAAADRLRVLAEVPLLEVTADVKSLAGALLEEVPLPPKAATDALHIAVAAVTGVEYLLTWNCRHIANPALRPRIESIRRRMGFEPPVICTPQELLEIDDGI